MKVVKTDKPEVSVVMCFYKEPLQWIRYAVESIIGQTYTDFEVIIICDNPDHAEGIGYIREVSKADHRISLVINPENLGPTRSFNIGIGRARGKYIARMDSDDISLPERFERQVNFLDSHPDVSVCATDAHIIDEKGRITRRNRYRKKYDPVLNLISNTIPHPSVMFRKGLLEVRNPIYNEDFIYSQDYELWQFLLLKDHRLHTVEEPLILYRKNSQQISTQKKQMQAELFRKAHKSFVTDWLLKRDIITREDSKDLTRMLEKSSGAFRNAEGDDRKGLALVIYLLYFSLGTLDWKYRLRYIADRNFIPFRTRFILNYRLFFSRKKRRSRIGLV